MKTDSPYDRGDIHINKNDKVLEIGPGHNPTYRSNVIAQKFIDPNYHRCGDVKIYPHQTFVHADGEKLPFKDKEFDGQVFSIGMYKGLMRVYFHVTATVVIGVNKFFGYHVGAIRRIMARTYF